MYICSWIYDQGYIHDQWYVYDQTNVVQTNIVHLMPDPQAPLFGQGPRRER